MSKEQLEILETRRMKISVLGICNGNPTEAERAWKWICESKTVREEKASRRKKR